MQDFEVAIQIMLNEGTEKFMKEKTSTANQKKGLGQHLREEWREQINGYKFLFESDMDNLFQKIVSPNK